MRKKNNFILMQMVIGRKYDGRHVLLKAAVVLRFRRTK